MNKLNREFENKVLYCRLAASIAIVCVLYHRETIDVHLIHIWNYLCHSPIFRHDSFEPVMASTCFAVNIFGWMIIDFHLPSLHQYRIHSNNTKNLAWKGREQALYQEALWYLAPWLVIDFFYPRRILPLQSPTLVATIFEVIVGLLLYDLFFFCGHYFVLHGFRNIFESVHAKHHVNAVIQAPDSIRHTFLDGTWDVMCSVISLNLMRAHPFSRSIFNMVAITLIVEAHSGYNMPYMLHNLLPRNWVAGPVVHDLHHRIGSVNFQKFFTYLDSAYGTFRSS